MDIPPAPAAPAFKAPKRTLLDKVLDATSLLCTVITGVALVVLTVIFGWLVFGRYVLNSTPTWVEQVSLLLVVLITFLGAAVGIHENTHLGVSYFRDIAKPWLRKLCTVLSHLGLAVFGYVMMVQSYDLMMFKWDTMIPLINISEGFRMLPITLCGGLVLIYSIGHLVDMVRGVPERRSPYEEG